MEKKLMVHIKKNENNYNCMRCYSINNKSNDYIKSETSVYDIPGFYLYKVAIENDTFVSMEAFLNFLDISINNIKKEDSAEFIKSIKEDELMAITAFNKDDFWNDFNLFVHMCQYEDAKSLVIKFIMDYKKQYSR